MKKLNKRVARYRMRIENMMDASYRDFMKALFSIEYETQDQEYLDKIYQHYIEHDECDIFSNLKECVDYNLENE